MHCVNVLVVVLKLLLRKIERLKKSLSIKGYLFKRLVIRILGKPRIKGKLYLIYLKKNTLLHMYDECGCDVYGLNKENLLPLCHKFRK
ncbi:DUF3885 domain-containing protein [Amphibacillus sediminis]|uniref:DUF3885 domain-containing protein n=1 Tax=Amphibacillus sediminis TaxID=360185 RepID=UPI0012EE34CA